MPGLSFVVSCVRDVVIAPLEAHGVVMRAIPLEARTDVEGEVKSPRVRDRDGNLLRGHHESAMSPQRSG